MKKIDFAKAACALLNENGGWMESQYLLKRLEIPVIQHNAARAVLTSLADRGVLSKAGLGKFRWKLLNKDYDRDNPFKGTTDKPKPPITAFVKRDDLGLTWVHMGNGSYPHRVALRNLGCTWHDTARAWRIQGNRFSSAFQELVGNYADILTKLNNPEENVEEVKNTKANGTDFGPVFEKLLKQLDTLEDQVAKLHRVRKVELTIKHPDNTVTLLKGRVHPVFEQVMFHVNCGDNVMLVGPKGCGKTVLAEQLSSALKRDHGMISLSGGVTESKLFGRVVPNVNTGKNEYHSTLFVDLFEKGGVFLLDEVDAADPNVLLSINSALANGILALDRTKAPVAKRHKHFVCIAAANTWGNGADRQYVGRNQQDSAFTERFVQIAMDYDMGLEVALCPGAEDMVDHLHRYRTNVIANRLERTISTRFIVRAFNWIKAGKDLRYVDDMLFSGWREDEVRKVKGG